LQCLSFVLCWCWLVISWLFSWNRCWCQYIWSPSR
jgi:hypothetical protein